MASFADLRPIIIIICVAGFFTAFLGWVTAETPTFLSGVTIPTQQDRTLPSSLISYTNTTYIYITHTDGWTSTGTINNGTTSIKLYNNNATTPAGGHFLQVDTFVWGWNNIYQYDFESFTWYTNSSRLEMISEPYTPVGQAWATWPGLSITTLDTMYAAQPEVMNLTCFIANSHTSSNVRFAFDNGTYSSPSAAWIADALAISFDAGYEETKSANNAFTTIIGLLTWSLPGIPSWLFILVDLAFFAPALYVVAIWVLRIIGSVLGGGGSG